MNGTGTKLTSPSNITSHSRARERLESSNIRVNFNNLIKVPLAELQPRMLEFFPSLTLTNTMSLAPKIDEVISFVEVNNTDLLFITETWLTDLVSINYLQIPTYNLICKNRSSGAHGGVCLYIKNSIKYEIVEDLHVSVFEVLWVRITPTRLPRGFSSIVIGTVYHPPSANAKSMLEYLFKSLTEIEGQNPDCGLLLAGDFNRLDIKSLVRQFKMKQLVHFPTRKDQTLDFIITNLFQYYSSEPLTIHPSFRLSDHNVVTLYPKERPAKAQTKKVVKK